MIPKRPKYIYDYGAQDEELAHVRAVAVRAVRALRELEAQHSGGPTSHKLSDCMAILAGLALREIEASGWKD